MTDATIRTDSGCFVTTRVKREALGSTPLEGELDPAIWKRQAITLLRPDGRGADVDVAGDMAWMLSLRKAC